MANKIKIKPGQTVSLKVTPEERELLLENLIFDDADLEPKLRIVVAGSQQIQLTLAELEDLGGCVAAAANHTKDRRVQKKLDRIGDRIKGLLGLFEEI